MLNLPKITESNQGGRNLRRERRLWHEGKQNTPSLGCTVCPDRKLCGGLNIGGALYDCLGNCCGNPSMCDSVCRNKHKDFAERVREINGFDFDNIPRSKRLSTTPLPSVVPVVFNGSRRIRRFSTPMVCLPLYKIIARQNGGQRFINREELAKEFQIDNDTHVILTGTERDAPLERWWGLSSKRLDTIQLLRELDVKLVTTPNFSLFTDQPRWDDLHSMKRIGITHEEFLRVGLPAALHVNARTDRDWERWAEYILSRKEVTHIAFEYKTGAGWAGRVNWQTDQLVNLGKNVGRPLHLVVRGGAPILTKLISSFGAVTMLDTTTSLKTIQRQYASLSTDGKINWEALPTPKNAPLDDLLAHNWSIMKMAYDHIRQGPKFTGGG